MRTAKELLIATREFAGERRWQSWWHLWSTLILLLSLLVFAASDLAWYGRLSASLLAGLVCVRMFIIFHDFQHHAILKNSRFAAIVFWIYGVLTMNPPSVWNRSHSHHHKHNSKTFGINIGSFPLMTCGTFLNASAIERLGYAIARHPLTIFCGYWAVFFWGMSLRPFIQHPIRHFDGGLAAIVQLSLLACIGFTFGLQSMLFAMFIPLFTASSIGAYLFYAQHNFPSARLCNRSNWNHVDAALNSSSHMKMGRMMNWFTGNIGFHHVHHLNALIPFYRLPETMAALEELQSPGVTTLKLRDINACLKLKLWDADAERFVGFDENSWGGLRGVRDCQFFQQPSANS